MLDVEKAALISDIRSQMKGAIHKLYSVNLILATLPSGPERDQSLELIKRICASEMKLLSRIPNFEYLLDKQVLEVSL